MPTTDEDFLFLVNKITEIKTAVFKPDMDSGFNLPNNIISTIRTDEEGNIWFFTSGKVGQAKNISKDFFAYLEYSQNEQHCRIRLSGKARIVEDERETGMSPTLPIDNRISNIVLIKFKILYAEYFEDKPDRPVPIKNKGKTGLYGFLYSVFTHDVQFFPV